MLIEEFVNINNAPNLILFIKKNTIITFVVIYNCNELLNA